VVENDGRGVRWDELGRVSGRRGTEVGIKVECSACGKGLVARDELAGKKVKCPGCGSGVAIPVSPVEMPEPPGEGVFEMAPPVDSSSGYEEVPFEEDAEPPCQLETKAGPSSGEMHPLLVALFGAPFLVVGILVVSFGVRNYAETKRAETWPSVEASVKWVEIEQRQSSRGHGPYYVIRCEYEYEWQGRTYVSGRPAFKDSKRSYDDDLRQRTRFDELKQAKEGNVPVTAYVDPDHPARAVVYRGVQRAFLVWAVLGGVFVLAGGLLVLAGLRAAICRVLNRESE